MPLFNFGPSKKRLAPSKPPTGANSTSRSCRSNTWPVNETIVEEDLLDEVVAMTIDVVDEDIPTIVEEAAVHRTTEVEATVTAAEDLPPIVA